MVFVALHDAEIEAGDPKTAKIAVERGMGPLSRRLRGLAGTPYARVFLKDLPYNDKLLGLAKEYVLVPPDVSSVLD